MNSAKSMLVLDGVTRHFGDVAALQDVSLEVGEGLTVCLVGHSGCGKSTLLRSIAGIETLDHGSILIDGVPVSGHGVFVQPEHRHVGFMFQDYALFPHLSVRANIGFGLSGLARSERDLRVADIIERIGIGALADRYPHMLSGGEQQRVALARALAPRPRLLLMDEPFSNLDRGLRDKVRLETMSIVRDLGMTAVVVTHDPEEALAIGDMVALMKKGRLVEAGSGERMYDAPWTAYAASFFSRINTIPATSSAEGLQTPLGRFPAPALKEGVPKVLLRPQAISLAATGISARVIERSVLGELEELSLAVEGLTAPLIMRGTARHDVRPGDEVFLQVNARQVMVFPDDDAQD
ncbi:ABC transporter ATP-binding protein [Devosia sp. XJ19-1]|uniref:ABC transporter ATP-binding protein n=1 Tax=Devosia ureilytica TaxID=2952754 RepID=A0A9Q4FRB7_9HYPH|nr:ABC transporter ATP-binding protein [Devosia ureilytica]MCP8883663.1 ABC transporter ATP-binding protein [Devosia ureilytica]MCP8887271.1 ABC transporter ATP-binding protein [Devosia ureilytica]